MAAGAQYTALDINNQVLSICRDFTVLMDRINKQNQYLTQLGGSAALQATPFNMTATDANNIISAFSDLAQLAAIAGNPDGVTGVGTTLVTAKNFYAFVRWCRGNTWS